MKAMHIFISFLFLFLLCITHGFAEADQFKIAIMQDEKDAAQKYRPLVTYLKARGVDVSLVETVTYPAAASMFASGAVDAMFSGSAVAATMIIKDLATPLLRPLDKDGFSTYSAVILAPKGSLTSNGSTELFANKKIVFCGLASAGEVYFRSLENISASKSVTMKSASHAAAIDTLAKGYADIAIVKNRVWERLKTKYPELVVVGADKGANPDNTLIVAKKANPETVAKVSDALLLLRNDKSEQAQAVRDQLNIQGYIKTTKEDFKHTFALLKKAGVDKSFNFAFK